MRITIKSNNNITNAKITKCKDVCKNHTSPDNIYMIEFDFAPAALWSDLEFWLDDENGNYCDHIALNVTKRLKMQTHK